MYRQLERGVRVLFRLPHRPTFLLIYPQLLRKSSQMKTLEWPARHVEASADERALKPEIHVRSPSRYRCFTDKPELLPVSTRNKTSLFICMSPMKRLYLLGIEHALGFQ